MAARKGQRLGSLPTHQPNGYSAAVLVVSILLLSILGFACFGAYARKVYVAELLMPKQGLLVPPSSGKIGAASAQERQVAANHSLFALTTAQLTSARPPHELTREQLLHRLAETGASAGFSCGRQARELALTARRLEALDAESAQIGP